MKDVLFVQGAGEGVHAEWDLKLVESLRHELGSGYEVRYPSMPNEADASFATWKPALEKELAPLRNGAIVVGPLSWRNVFNQFLAGSARTNTLAAIALIAAPFIGEHGWTNMPEPFQALVCGDFQGVTIN